MNNSISFDEGQICTIGTERKITEPNSIIIFGASGDLTARKLIPALYHLFKDKQMPPAFRVIGFARREKTDESWRAELRTALDQFSRTKPVDDKVWANFPQNMFLLHRRFDGRGGLSKAGTKIKFLRQSAAAPKSFVLSGHPAEPVWRRHRAIAQREIAAQRGTATAGKPSSSKNPSATISPPRSALNNELTRFAHEQQIFRIDHYLGKETVQNILMFRFSNSIFERLWNRDSVDHVQITVSEKLGVGERGGYYEEAGALRDMVQNHMLQVLVAHRDGTARLARSRIRAR